MKRYFQNIDVECWVYHPGRRLGSSDPCICLSHTKAVQGVSPILQALDELKAGGPPSKLTGTFKPCDRPKSISTLRLRLVTDSQQLRVMDISRENAAVTIEMTTAGLEIVRNAIIAWGEGAEDFGISAEHGDHKKNELGARDLTSGEMWFWGPRYDP
ncbi:MAG: hypothetical protein HN350_08915 [Phycisphaerales bacterium]|nr:hypothetical protein [Phycisphaerales bacterium]